jgi:hypothetical protein
LHSPRLEDFSPIGFELPSRCASLAGAAARLFAASRLLDALDGDWLPAGEDLLAAAAAGFRLLSSGRTLEVNSLGKDMIELSLRALAALLNRPECPSDLVRLLLQRLPARPVGQFGTATVRAFTCLNFAAVLARLKKNRIVDPWLLKGFFREPAALFALERFVAISGLRLFTAAHALAAFFVQENETLTSACVFWENGRAVHLAGAAALCLPQPRLEGSLRPGPAAGASAAAVRPGQRCNPGRAQGPAGLGCRARPLQRFPFSFQSRVGHVIQYRPQRQRRRRPRTAGVVEGFRYRCPHKVRD